VADANKRVTIADFRDGLILLRKGKRSYHVVRLGVS
jgi:hypothetical protein